MMTPEQQDWLKVVYEQAWDQYAHEDQMSEQRDTKYLTILTLFLTAAGVLCTMVLSYIFSPGETGQFSKIYALGMLLVILLIARLVQHFLKHWKSVNETAQEFIQMRLKTIREIEAKMDSPVQLAEPEKKKIDENEKNDGFGSTRAVIRLLTAVSYILMGLAIVAASAVAIFL